MPKVVDHKQRAAELADAALDITSELGVNAVTMRAIAERSGWSTGVLNYYFASRQDILAGALHRAAALQGNVFKAILGDAELTPMRRLQRLIESVLPLDGRRLALTRVFLMFYAESMSNTMIQKEIRTYLGNWREVVQRTVREAQACETIDDALDAGRLAADLVALSDGLAMHALMEPAIAEQLREHGLTLSLFGRNWRLEGIEGYADVVI